MPLINNTGLSSDVYGIVERLESERGDTAKLLLQLQVSDFTILTLKWFTRFLMVHF